MQPDASRRTGKQGSAVIAKRIFAGSLAVLLLCVSYFAAACDLSCGFAQFQSDCHSPQTAPKESVSPEMTMAGMTVPEIPGGSSTNQEIVSSAPQEMPAHAVLVDMGTCEDQSCNQAHALASKANHSATAQFQTISTVAGFSHMDSLQTAFREALDGIAPLSPIVHTPRHVSLRI